MKLAEAAPAPSPASFVRIDDVSLVYRGAGGATSGRVAIGGRQVEGPSREVGIVFQRDVLLEWRTLLHNLLLPIEVERRPAPADVERARSLLGRGCPAEGVVRIEPTLT